MSDKKNPIRFRHKVLTVLFSPLLYVLCRILYHAKIDKFRDTQHRPYLILANHQTDFDQFFVSVAFDRPVYYVAMEDIFSMGFLSRIIEWAFAPISINKASTDIKAVMTCMRVAKNGGTIALFPEGNRTYSGKTCYIKPAVAALAKKLNLPIAFFKIEGGYGIKPRWAGKRRGGSMKAGVRRVIEPEELKTMTTDELYHLICEELNVDEIAEEREFPSDTSAEYIERALYVCPDCGLSRFESHGKAFSCVKCGKEFEYRPDLKIQPKQGTVPFRYFSDWYEYQENFIRDLDLSAYLDTPAYCEKANLSEIIVRQKKVPLKTDAEIRLFGDRVEVGSADDLFPMLFEHIKAMACIADNKLNIFHQDKIYQIRGDKKFNALKYCNFYYHARFLKGNKEDGEFQFLGL